ncbi:hypothetical protein [Winogradskya consettensis]|nr:hypothetical protein [Actinoplanes consettensis]
MAAVSAVDSVSSSSEAQAALIKYQQKLAADLAAKAAEKVITADKDAVTKAQQAVQQSAQSSPAVTASAATASTGVLDVTV